MHKKLIGQGEHVVFLHGWGGDVSAFLFTANRLKDRYKCLLLDLYGFGLTPEPSRAYTVGDYADGVAAEMENAGMTSAVIVGHSFGGRVALELAAKYPNKVVSLVLVDGAGLKPRRKLSYFLKVYSHKFLIKLGFSGLKGSRDYQTLSPVMKKTFISVVNYDQTHLLRKISCPTAIFWGKEDKVTPPYMAKKFKKGIRDSEIFWLKGGHFAYVEDEAVFLPVLTAFLENTAGGGSKRRL